MWRGGKDRERVKVEAKSTREKRLDSTCSKLCSLELKHQRNDDRSEEIMKNSLLLEHIGIHPLHESFMTIHKAQGRTTLISWQTFSQNRTLDD